MVNHVFFSNPVSNRWRDKRGVMGSPQEQRLTPRCVPLPATHSRAAISLSVHLLFIYFFSIFFFPLLFSLKRALSPAEWTVIDRAKRSLAAILPRLLLHPEDTPPTTPPSSSGVFFGLFFLRHSWSLLSAADAATCHEPCNRTARRKHRAGQGGAGRH